VGFEVGGVVSCEYRQLSPLIQYPPAKNLHGSIWKVVGFWDWEFGSFDAAQVVMVKRGKCLVPGVLCSATQGRRRPDCQNPLLIVSHLIQAFKLLG
jgi:hypothetical protein